ncbi:peptidyl-prolyl cis-trans isomerase [Amantichitinum ursilacus]|nr:peptidylprolyl isomerase [Amantichitinum ursilacus]
MDRQYLNTLLKAPTAISQLPEFGALSRLLTTDDAYWYAAALIPPAKPVVTEARIAELYAKELMQNEAKRSYSVQRAIFSSSALAEQFHKRLSADPERFREEGNPLLPKAMRPAYESDRVTLQQMQDYDPAFTKAVLALKKGEISAPIKTVGGWEVVKLNSLGPEPLPPLAEIHDKLKARLENQDKSRNYDPFEATRKAAVIKIAPTPGQPLVDVRWPDLGMNADECGCDFSFS